jgi:hypothetical protein
MYQRPTTKKEPKRFLGLVGHYRFCRIFSTAVTPLTNLLRGDAKYIWSDVCQQVFENVKSVLCAAPVLAAPHMDEVDASQVGAGAVLPRADELDIDKLLASSQRNDFCCICIFG